MSTVITKYWSDTFTAPQHIPSLLPHHFPPGSDWNLAVILGSSQQTVQAQFWLSPHHLSQVTMWFKPHPLVPSPVPPDFCGRLLSDLYLWKACPDPAPFNGGGLCLSVLCLKPFSGFQLVEWTPESLVQSHGPHSHPDIPHLLLPWTLALVLPSSCFWILPEMCLPHTIYPFTSIQMPPQRGFPMWQIPLSLRSLKPSYHDLQTWLLALAFLAHSLCISLSVVFPSCSSHQIPCVQDFCPTKKCPVNQTVVDSFNSCNSSVKKVWIISPL